MNTAEACRSVRKNQKMKLTRLILGFVVPPVGVFLTYGISTTLFINILLTILGWVPGIIHAVWAIAKYYENEDRDRRVAENADKA
jgi:uncharacterized membrane protein YqaE (UPF0057 family)